MIRILAVRMNVVKLPGPVVTRATEKNTETGPSGESAPFCPRVFLLSAYRPEGWMVGAVGIELKATVKSRKLLNLINAKTPKFYEFAEATYMPGTCLCQ